MFEWAVVNLDRLTRRLRRHLILRSFSLQGVVLEFAAVRLPRPDRRFRRRARGGPPSPVPERLFVFRRFLRRLPELRRLRLRRRVGILHRIFLGLREHGFPLLHRRRLLLSLLREAQHLRLPAREKLHLTYGSLVRGVQRWYGELLHRFGLLVHAAHAPRVLRVLPPIDGGVHSSGAIRADTDVLLSALATVLVLVPEPEHRLMHAGSRVRLERGSKPRARERIRERLIRRLGVFGDGADVLQEIRLVQFSVRVNLGEVPRQFGEILARCPADVHRRLAGAVLGPELFRVDVTSRVEDALGRIGVAPEDGHRPGEERRAQLLGEVSPLRHALKRHHEPVFFVGRVQRRGWVGRSGRPVVVMAARTQRVRLTPAVAPGDARGVFQRAEHFIPETLAIRRRVRREIRPIERLRLQVPDLSVCELVQVRDEVILRVGRPQEGGVRLVVRSHVGRRRVETNRRRPRVRAPQVVLVHVLRLVDHLEPSRVDGVADGPSARVRAVAPAMHVGTLDDEIDGKAVRGGSREDVAVVHVGVGVAGVDEDDVLVRKGGAEQADGGVVVDEARGLKCDHHLVLERSRDGLDAELVPSAGGLEGRVAHEDDGGEGGDGAADEHHRARGDGAEDGHGAGLLRSPPGRGVARQERSGLVAKIDIGRGRLARGNGRGRRQETRASVHLRDVRGCATDFGHRSIEHLVPRLTEGARAGSSRPRVLRSEDLALGVPSEAKPFSCADRGVDSWRVIGKILKTVCPLEEVILSRSLDLQQ